jgi:hypothetical protein
MRLDGNLVAAKDTVTKLPRHKAILLSLIDGIYHRTEMGSEWNDPI